MSDLVGNGGSMRVIQRYAMEPIYTESNCTMKPSVALFKHPDGQVVLFADHAKIVADLSAENVELTRKGQELCSAYGNALITIHDLTKPVTEQEIKEHACRQCSTRSNDCFHPEAVNALLASRSKEPKGATE